MGATVQRSLVVPQTTLRGFSECRSLLWFFFVGAPWIWG